MTIESTQDFQNPTVTEDAGSDQPAANLTLQDLVLVAQMIQVCSQRGAYRAEELTQIGGLYTKLVTFLQQSGALTPAETQE